MIVRATNTLAYYAEALMMFQKALFTLENIAALVIILALGPWVALQLKGSVQFIALSPKNQGKSLLGHHDNQHNDTLYNNRKPSTLHKGHLAE